MVYQIRPIQIPIPYPGQDLQFQLTSDQEVYDALSRRVHSLEVAQQAQPRITLHSRAEVEKFIDQRWLWGFSIAVIGIVATLIAALARDVRRDPAEETVA